MEYLEIRIETTPQAVEPVLGFLMSRGIRHAQVVDAADFTRFLEQHPGQWDYADESLGGGDAAQVVFYLSPGAAEYFTQLEDALRALPVQVPGIDFGTLALSRQVVDDENWLHEWKKTFVPFAVGNVVVRPSWSPPLTVFTLEPGAVFGTGQHASTQLCILALQKLLPRPGTDVRVLDIGCGSGILGIIALLLGASAANGCDIDPAAEKTATENAVHNGVSARFAVHTMDIFQTRPPGTYHIVLANIAADAIIGLAGIAAPLLCEGAAFVVSGIITGRLQEVCSALSENGFTVADEQEMDGWHCLVCYA